MLLLKGYMLNIPEADELFKISIFRVDKNKLDGRGDTMAQDTFQSNGLITGMHLSHPFIGGEYGFELSGACVLTPKYVSVPDRQ